MPRSSDFIARLGFTTYTLVVCLTSIFSNNWVAVVSRYSGGAVFSTLLLLTGTLLVIDLVINDLMPERFVFQWGLKWRHWVYPCVSFAFTSLLFIAEQTYKSVPLDALAVYGSMALIGVVLSFRNLFSERGRVCKEH
jgi:hypothetical protein